MVKIYTKEEINKIAASGKILSKTLRFIKNEIQIGVSLKYLDKLARDFIKKSNAEPAFLGYHPEGAKRPYPSSICASLNNVVVHGVPNDYALKDGDVLKIDLGVKYNGFYSDAAFTTIVGRGSEKAKNIVKAAHTALEEVIRHVRPGNRLGDLGFAISKTANRFGVNVITGLTGHGIGENLHEDPIIYNFGDPGHGLELKPGMVLAIEPMFSAGTSQIIQLKDDSWATKDGSLAAHFEHTVVVADKGPLILTD
ncbi:type I methionyl aminopeptidase [Candidatus Wolfebacteria bacterium]|nr:type I methionyl aminopeptidase [Candidatus Wolfebacteria bacterium]